MVRRRCSLVFMAICGLDMRTCLRLAWTIISTLIVELLIFTPLFLMGIPALGIALSLAPTDMQDSIWDPSFKRIAFKWKWLDAWLGNYEDGLCPPWWDLECEGSNWTKRMKWFLRNPVTNLRFCPIISTKPKPDSVGWIGDDYLAPDGVPGFFVCWQGLYGGIRWQNAKRGIWFGWKVIPTDRFGVHDYRLKGIGISCHYYRFR